MLMIDNFTGIVMNFINSTITSYFTTVKTQYQLVKETSQCVYIDMVKFTIKVMSLVQGDEFDCKLKNFIIKQFVV